MQNSKLRHLPLASTGPCIVQFSSPHQRQRSVRRFDAKRQGKAVVFALVMVCVVVFLVVAAAWFVGRRQGAIPPELLTTAVWKGPYDFAVIEQGTVESGSNTELRCEVHSRGGSTTILDVVPEGTFVNEGDVVVELDPSNLLLDENAQKILVSTRELLVAQAENTLKAAVIAKREYDEGLFVTQEKTLLSELYIAERAKAMAEAKLESSKVLYTKNITSALQVEAAQVSLEDALNLLDNAQTSLNTLRNLTRPKELTLLEAAIASADADLKAQQQSLRLEQSRLQDIQQQIANCTIKATAAGQVVYANETSSYRSSSQSQFVVTPGALVRERQVIIRLPNSDDMQINATVNEARVTQIHPGMPVSIRLDALKDEIIEGEVLKVDPFAVPSSFWSGSIRRYATTIKIKNPPRELRVGMNAEVRIHVAQTPSALQLPVEALAETQGRYFALVKSGDDYETREVTINSTNDQVATIARGLQEGDEVVLNPRSAGGFLKLPNLPSANPLAMEEIKRIDPREASGGRLVKRSENEQDETLAAAMTPADMVEEFLEGDANQDDRLSPAEVGRLDTHLQQRLATADANGDGFLERRELQVVATKDHRQPRGKTDDDVGPPASAREQPGGNQRTTANGEHTGGA